MRHGFQLFLSLTEFEKKFSLCLGGPDFDETPRFDDIILNVGPNPPDGIRYQAVSLIGIEFLNGVHETDIAFLNQV